MSFCGAYLPTTSRRTRRNSGLLLRSTSPPTVTTTAPSSCLAEGTSVLAVLICSAMLRLHHLHPIHRCTRHKGCHAHAFTCWVVPSPGVLTLLRIIERSIPSGCGVNTT